METETTRTTPPARGGGHAPGRRRRITPGVLLVAALITGLLLLPVHDDPAEADSFRLNDAAHLQVNPSLGLAPAGATVAAQLFYGEPNASVAIEQCLLINTSENCQTRTTATVAADGSLTANVALVGTVNGTNCLQNRAVNNTRCVLRMRYTSGAKNTQVADSHPVRFSTLTVGQEFAGHPRFRLPTTGPTTVTTAGQIPGVNNFLVELKQCNGNNRGCTSLGTTTTTATGTFAMNVSVLPPTATVPCQMFASSLPSSCMIQVDAANNGGTFGLIPISFAGSGGFDTPPKPSFAVTPTTGQAPLLVNVDGNSSCGGNGECGDTPIVSANWNWGDGTSTGTLTDPSRFIQSHTYTSYGQKVITLTVTNQRSISASTTRTITVEDADPVANLVLTDLGSGQIRASGATSSRNGGSPIASYRWTWGDGTNPTGPQPGATANHTYAGFGTFNVGLTVTNQTGLTSTTTQAITFDQGTFKYAPALKLAFTQVPMPTDGATTIATLDTTGTTDPDGNVPITYDVNWGDGTIETNRPGPLFNHVYGAAGRFTATVTAKDTDGRQSSTTRKVVAYNRVQTVGLTPGTSLKWTSPLNVDSSTAFSYSANLTASSATVRGSGTGYTQVGFVPSKVCITDHWTVSYNPNTSRTVGGVASSTNWSGFVGSSVTGTAGDDSYAWMVSPTSNPATVGTGTVSRQLREDCTTGKATKTMLAGGGAGQVQVIAALPPSPNPAISIRCISHWQSFTVYNGANVHRRVYSSSAPTLCRR